MKVSKLLCVLGIASMICGCATTKSPQASQMGSELRRLLELEKQKNAATAVNEEETLNKLPEMNAGGYEMLGDQHAKQGNVILAVVQYGKALQLNSGNTGVRYKMGRLLLQRGLAEEAMKEFEEILKREPANALAHHGKGMVFLARNELGKAENEFREALDLNSTLWQTYAYLGIIYDRQKRFAFASLGRFDEAFEAFKKGRDEASAHNNIGYIYMIEQKYAEAAAALQEALEANPSFYVKAEEDIERLQALTRKPQSADQAIRTE